ncbi:MAG: monovalent cation/H+ antiporter subunit D family protein [Firmicutes bacterium]|nr:monovalent cation/H+ antiporter subunit D family protein [Bacillota bacterium]
MMIDSMRPMAALAIPMAAALLILLFGNKIKPNLREAITMAAAILMAATVFSMAQEVTSGKELIGVLLPIADGIDLKLKVDSAGMIFASIASGLWILTSVYSIGYMRGHEEKNQTGYFAAFAMCLASAAGIAFAANLLTFFIFYEMLTIATYPLVVHHRDEKAKKAGRKYLAYTLISGQLFFAAIVFVYVKYGVCEFVAGGFMMPEAMEKPVMCLLFLLMILGGAVKAGVMPLHGWLPSAMVAPTPVSALLHAVAVVKAGVFCVFRVVCYVFGPESAAWCGGAGILSWFAAITIVLSSLIALQQDNLKARLAYSTVGQLSYIVLGISLLSAYSITGALFHMVAHAFLKITLFMCAGAIFVRLHLSEISTMGGLARRMPVTAGCFAVASLGLAGLPLMSGFVSKANLLAGAAAMGKPFFIVVLLGAALLALSYLMPVSAIFFGKQISHRAEPMDGASTMVIPLTLTVTVGILLGIWPNLGLHLYDLAIQAAAAIMEGGAGLG